MLSVLPLLLLSCACPQKPRSHADAQPSAGAPREASNENHEDVAVRMAPVGVGTHGDSCVLGRAGSVVATAGDVAAWIVFDSVDVRRLCWKVGDAQVRSLAPVHSDKPEENLELFDDLVFSHDGRTLYFTTFAWVVSSAAHALDTSTGAHHFVADGAVLLEVSAGSDSGAALLQQWHLDQQSPVESPRYRGRMEVFALYSPQGVLRRRVSEPAAKRLMSQRPPSKLP